MKWTHDLIHTEYAKKIDGPMIWNIHLKWSADKSQN